MGNERSEPIPILCSCNETFQGLIEHHVDHFRVLKNVHREFRVIELLLAVQEKVCGVKFGQTNKNHPRQCKVLRGLFKYAEAQSTQVFQDNHGHRLG